MKRLIKSESDFIGNLGGAIIIIVVLPVILLYLADILDFLIRGLPR